jgi:copper homeostasis protein
MDERTTIEVCVETVAGALAAAAAGADRLELCSGLALGGLTPGPGLLLEVCERVGLPLVVLCRPRRGDFLYDSGDLATLGRDIDAARNAGAAAVALGVLRADGTIDASRTADLIARARPMEVCFHRAFDLTADQDAALETLMELGVDRVLTSGGENDVVQGLDRIAHLVTRAAGQLVILPGGGVSELNVRGLVATTRVSEVHLSAGRVATSCMAHRAEVSLGSATQAGEYELRVTDPARIRALRRALGG